MAVHSVSRPASLAINRESVSWHVMWFLSVSLVAFLIPFTFTSVLDTQHDLYYLLYFAITLGMLAAYVTTSQINVLDYVRHAWRWSLAIGLLSTAFVVWSVLGRIDSTPHPGGAYFAFEIVWRGVGYAIVDALLLSAFPGLIALELMHRDLSGVARRATYAALALVLVVFLTGTYHVGYDDLRDKDVVQPEIGNVAISLPVLLTANPIGSVMAHTSMHLAAVTHSYESKDRLPPQTFVDGDRSE